MRGPSRRWFGMLAIGLAAGLLGSSARGDDKKLDATGTWKWTVERNGQTFEPVLKLKQDGEKLTGTISGRNGNETEIENGKVKDGEVSFTVTRTFGDNKIVQKYHGKLSGDSIKGKIEFERDGEAQSRDWEAKRS
jgi:hypothetical protein